MSLAEQVAAMAAKRQQRVSGNTEEPEENNNGNKVAASAPATVTTLAAPKPVAPTPVPAAPKPAVPRQTSESNSKKKVGGFFGGTTTAAKTPAEQPKKASNAILTPAGQAAAEPHTIKSYKPDPIPVQPPKVQNTEAVFTQSRLKPTGIRGDESPAVQLARATAPQETALALPEITGKTTTTTTTVTKTKRVTKSDPEYDIVEYKVGCGCSIM
jgi:hypothetical protein